MVAIIILAAVGCSEGPGPTSTQPQEQYSMSDDKPRVTGIGGIFFKSEDPGSNAKLVQR